LKKLQVVCWKPSSSQAESPEWDPYDEKTAASEDACLRRSLEVSSLRRISSKEAGDFSIPVVSRALELDSLYDSLRETFSLNISAVASGQPWIAATPELLSQRWSLGLDTARKTIGASQLGGDSDLRVFTTPQMVDGKVWCAKAVWDYCLRLTARIRSHLCNNKPELEGIVWRHGSQETRLVSRASASLTYMKWVW